jgi:hypothetical protein
VAQLRTAGTFTTSSPFLQILIKMEKQMEEVARAGLPSPSLMKSPMQVSGR